MLIKTLPVGQLETNCYVVTDEKSLICAVIDPGDESNTILDYLEDNHLRCTHILITHGHYDHTMAVSAVKEATGAEVYMNEKDAHADLQSASLKYNPPAGTHFYKDGDTVDVGGLRFTVLETPGHSAGSVCLLCEDAISSGSLLRIFSGVVSSTGASWRISRASASWLQSQRLPSTGSSRSSPSHEPVKAMRSSSAAAGARHT